MFIVQEAFVFLKLGEFPKASMTVMIGLMI